MFPLFCLHNVNLWVIFPCMSFLAPLHDIWRRQMDAIRSAEEMERARKRTAAASELAAAAAAEYMSNKR